MAKPEQIIIIDPQNELKFRGPFNVPVTAFMKLTNPTDKKVVFKIKTTAPKKYCVRPNSGILDPKNVIEIAICLQPFIFDPAEKNKHKFMVQTVVAPDGDFNPENLWKDISPENLMDSKLKCMFEMPAQEGTNVSTGSVENAETEEKVKRVTELKASPKGTSNSTVTNLDSELVKAAQEVKQLREEESNLRQENLQLKEEVLRLKHNLGSATNIGQQMGSKYTPVAPAAPFPMLLVAITIAVGIFGIILGKFIL